MPIIIQKEHPALRAIAAEIPLKDITGNKIRTVLKHMRSALDSQDDGVAIAAPQIGKLLRMFIVSQQVLKNRNGVKPKDLVCINPMIIKCSKEIQLLEEGCLSVRWLYGEVPRAAKATIRAYDETGTLFTRGASGLLAQIFQHETDHLNGILFTDKAKNLRELLPLKKEKQQGTHSAR